VIPGAARPRRLPVGGRRSEILPGVRGEFPPVRGHWPHRRPAASARGRARRRPGRRRHPRSSTGVPQARSRPRGHRPRGSDRQSSPSSMARTVLIGIGLLALAACAGPAARFQDRAIRLGFHRTVVAGTAFQHVVYWSAGAAGSRSLHIYIDGDGRPWASGEPAPDPTPRNPLVLDLMALDPSPVAYLGRPCYHGQAEAPGCGPLHWTAARYSEAVVASMAAAARRLVQGGGHEQIRWFGYSGGGTLAMLLAARFEETASVVTVAANLDVERWARLHGYQRLTGSLNPAAGPGLPSSVRQRHYAGERDDVVPPHVVAAAPIAPGTLVVIPGYDHRCCWTTLWPRVLRDIVGAPAAENRRPPQESQGRHVAAARTRHSSKTPAGIPGTRRPGLGRPEASSAAHAVRSSPR
jgi:hypothetical protein